MALILDFLNYLRYLVYNGELVFIFDWHFEDIRINIRSVFF